ncbi:hypothetical protein ACRCD7_05395 [Aliarcobacter sp. ERUVET-7]|uniref:hypothetical protein n=1 Tax=Aliarcobacter sp. ERUVET-7 TaxID=3429683 RepID=UPI003D6A6A52
MYKINIFYFLFFILWIVSIFLYNLNLVNNLHSFNNILLVLSTMAYLIFFYKPQINISISLIIIIFIFLKISILIFSLIDYDIFYHYLYTGDAYNYHFPSIEKLDFSNWLGYIFEYKMYAVETGKLTHLLYAIPYNLFNPFFELFSNDKIYNLHIISYIVNIFLLSFTSWYMYIKLKRIIETKYASYAVMLFLFSPFIFAWSNYLMKETLYVCLIIISTIAILEKKYFILFAVALFFLVDRMYMLYLFGLIFLLSNKINRFYMSMFIFLIVVTIYNIFPIQIYIDQLIYIMEYGDNNATSGSSLLSEGYSTNLLRVLFSPFFVSAFKEYYIYQNIFFREHLTVGILLTLFIFRILFNSKWNNFTYLIFLILLFNLVLFPYSARQKITVLIPILSIVYPLYLYTRKYNLLLKTFWKI